MKLFFYVLIILLFYVCSLKGYLFWSGELEANQFNFLGFEEDLAEAMNCFIIAIRVKKKKKKFMFIIILNY